VFFISRINKYIVGMKGQHEYQKFSRLREWGKRVGCWYQAHPIIKYTLWGIGGDYAIKTLMVIGQQQKIITEL